MTFGARDDASLYPPLSNSLQPIDQVPLTTHAQSFDIPPPKSAAKRFLAEIMPC